VHVGAEDEEGPHRVLELAEELLVALLLGDRHLLPEGEGMGAGGDDAHAVPPGELGDHAAHVLQEAVGLADVLRRRGADLDHRLVELGVQKPGQVGGGVGQDPARHGGEVPALGVDELVLFLDTDGEGQSLGHATSWNPAILTQLRR